MMFCFRCASPRQSTVYMTIMHTASGEVTHCPRHSAGGELALVKIDVPVDCLCHLHCNSRLLGLAQVILSFNWELIDRRL